MFNLKEEPSSSSEPGGGGGSMPDALHALHMRYQSFLDRISPHVAGRWVVAGLLMLAYVLRVSIAGGWYVISYGLGLYMMNSVISVVTPLSDDDTNMSLPVYNADEEHKPFVGRFSEFRFWLNCIKALTVALLLTMTRLTDIPVFWPILLIYFLILLAFTLKKQLTDMWRRRYIPVPWFGKRKPTGKGPRPPPQGAIPTHTFRTNSSRS